MILRPQASKALNKDKDAMKWLMEKPRTEYEIFDNDLSYIEETDMRCTIAMDPNAIRKGLGRLSWFYLLYPGS